MLHNYWLKQNIIKKYVNESKIIRQSNPPINVNNNFADYHEFYDIVINFIKPIYGNDLNKFIADSLDSTVINKIFNYYKNETSGFAKLYSLLGEMGNIGFAVASSNFTEAQRATDYDMIARDPHNFYLHYNKVLELINIILDKKTYIPGVEGDFGNGLKQ